MEFLVQPFIENEFMLNALMAGIFVAMSCAIVGTFMVLRGLAFMGDAIGHGVLPGIAIATLMGASGFLGAIAGSLVMIAGIGFVTRKSHLSHDTAIGLLFVGMLSLGVIIVSQSDSFSGDLIKILFGEILGVERNDILLQAGVVIILGSLAYVFRRPFLLLCFDEKQADVLGFPSKFYHTIMLIMTALAVIASFQTVGTLLVFGMLIAPAATSILWMSSLRSIMILASLLGTVSVFVGLLMSYYFNTAAGATITCVAVFIFFISLIVRQRWGS